MTKNFTFNGTAFIFKEDYTGPVVIVSKSHSVETTVDALEAFIKDKNEKFLKRFNSEESYDSIHGL